MAAETIQTLTEIPQYPTRKDPQDRFDTLIKAAVDGGSTMVSEINSKFIPQYNEAVPVLNSFLDNKDVYLAVPGKAAEAAASAVSAASSATAAEGSAATATTKASDASASAATATTKAEDAAASASTASTKADEAAASAGAAASSASDAETSAATATTKSGEAAVSAGEAATSASTATTKATEASTSADNAASSASAASVSATAAQTAQAGAEAARDEAQAIVGGNVVPETRTITAGTGLTGGGDLSANRTLAVNYGTAAGTACQGNDARLSDPRSPIAHTHDVSDVDGLGIASDSVVGLVKGDGVTTTVDQNGSVKVISSSSSATCTIPTITGGDNAPIGIVSSYTFSSICGLQNGIITSFEFTFNGSTLSVSASENSATAQITVPAGTAVGTEFTLEVMAIDNYGGSTKKATKVLTAISACVSAPTLTAPAANAYVSPTSITFTTSDFATVGATDTHAASRYKVTSDAAGSVVVYDSGRTTSGKTTFTGTLTTALTPGTTYYAFAQHEGAKLGVSGWSAAVPVVASSVLAPSITAPVEAAEVVYSGGITVTTSAFSCAGGVSDTHASTDWKITSDAAGNTVVAQAAASSDKTSHTFTGLTLTDGTTYYLFARHNGTACGSGPWSAARSFKAKKGVTTASGRLLYRHSSGMGTVMEFTDGTPRKVVVLDAKYRTKKKFGTYGLDMPNLTNYATANTHGDWDIDNDGDYDANTNNPQMTDAQLNAAWINSIDAKTAKQNCDEWMTKTSYTDSQSIVGVPAVQYCRSVTVDGVACDLPNIQTLMRMQCEANAIDALDPTVAQYPTYALGTANTSGFWNFGGTTAAWSSTEYSSYCVRYMDCNGQCSDARKDIECGVAPVLEI